MHLLTLTHGEATTQRHVYGYSLKQMAAVRIEVADGVQFERVGELVELPVESLFAGLDVAD